MKIDRRSFLALGVGVVAGNALSPVPAILTDDIAIWTQNWPWVPVPEIGGSAYADTTCQLCPGGCGISVRKVEERGVKIEGKKDHPVNNGGICALGLSGLQLLYGPTRVKTPLKRAGKRGEGKWIKISWDQAISEVAGKLNDLRSQEKAHTVAGISGSSSGTMTEIFRRFLTAYGSANFFHTPSIQDTYRLVFEFMHGKKADPGFDIENADFILSFGSSLLEGWGPPVRMLKASKKWKDTATKIIQIEPRLSRTALKAERWIPVTPGTEAVLALSLCHVIIKEGLYNKDFLANSTFGFEDYKAKNGEIKKGFKQLVMDDYSPEAASKITGLDPAAIILLAREFAKASAPLAIFGKGQGILPGSLSEAMAIHALNALCGSINRKGGIFALDVLENKELSEVALDGIAEAGLKQHKLVETPHNSSGCLNQAFSAILKGNSVNALLVLEANPLYTLSDSKSVKDAFDRIPFIASFSSFMDETAQYADMILPNHIYLERIEDVPLSMGFPKTVIGLSKPVFKPQYSTKHAGDTILLISKELGGSIADSFPWKNYEACLQHVLSDKMDVLKKKGFWTATDSFPDFKNAFRTASAKFEFQTDSLSSDLVNVKIEGDETYPLVLIPYETIRLSTGYIANPPFLTKAVEDTILKGKDSFIEINPKTAQASGFSEADMVLLQTPKGQARVRVHLEEGIMPGIIALPRGLGHTAYDNYIADKGINVNQLIGPVNDPVSGLDTAWGIRAKLSKA